MTHFAELITASAVSILRSSDFSQTLENSTHVVPDIYFSWDNEEGEVDVTLKSINGYLGEIWCKVSGAPRWLSLNLSLGACSFTAGDVLGLVIELENCPDQSFPAFIRSTREDDVLGDTYLDDILKGSRDRAVRTLLHKVSPHSNMVGEEAFHTLIIPLPRKDFHMNLRDIRLFVIPAARGLDTRPATVARMG